MHFSFIVLAQLNYIYVYQNYCNMKHFYFLIAIVSLLFSSCDWRRDPIVLGHGCVEINEDNKFVCSISGDLLPIDSVLFTDGIEKIYTAPHAAQKVTYFSIGKNKYFYDGIADAEEIKDVYFIDDNLNGDLNFCLLMVILIFIYGYTSCTENDEKNKKDAINQEHN